MQVKTTRPKRWLRLEAVAGCSTCFDSYDARLLVFFHSESKLKITSAIRWSLVTKVKKVMIGPHGGGVVAGEECPEHHGRHIEPVVKMPDKAARFGLKPNTQTSRTGQGSSSGASCATNLPCRCGESVLASTWFHANTDPSVRGNRGENCLTKGQRFSTRWSKVTTHLTVMRFSLFVASSVPAQPADLKNKCGESIALGT